MPKVSIITVCLNSAETIEDTIKSVLSQTYPNIEYIIIDGGSTDGTIDIVNRYLNQIAKFVSEKDRGIYDAMNKGIKLASGDIIGTLNADDFYNGKNVISDMVNIFAKENCDVLWGDLVYVKRGDTSRVVRYWKSSKYESGKFQKGWMPPHPTFFVKKWVYGKYGFFRSDFRLSADYELMLRFLEKYGIRSSYLPKVLVKMRAGGRGNKNLIQRLKAHLEDYRAWKINNLPVNPLNVILKPISKISQWFFK